MTIVYGRLIDPEGMELVDEWRKGVCPECGKETMCTTSNAAMAASTPTKPCCAGTAVTRVATTGHPDRTAPQPVRTHACRRRRC